MKKLEKFLALIGMTSDRYEKLSEAEQTQIKTLSDQIELAETARDTAVAELATANESITALTEQLNQASLLVSGHSDTITAHEATISAHEKTILTQATRISTQEATIAELKAELDNVPGSAPATVVTTTEKIPGEKQRKVRSWETN